MVLESVQALTFDVFGTVVDWHGSVVRELKRRTQQSSSGEVKSFDDKGDKNA